MTNDVFGNLGSEMKTMKDGRENLKVEIKDHHDRLRVETGRTLAAASEFLSQTGKANDRLAAQTRHILAQADKDLKAQALRTAAEAHDLLAAIRKAVAALKADAGQIRSDGRSFLTQTGVENTKLKDRTWKMLAHARAESKTQARQRVASGVKVMAQTKASVARLKTDTGRLLADAAGVITQLSRASGQRAAEWQDILSLLHGRTSRPISPVAAAATANGKGHRKATVTRPSDDPKGCGRKAA